EYVKKKGIRSCFHLGSGSSCRSHLRQHYSVYKERCDAAGIEVHHWAIPRITWRKMEAEREAK
ncbi:hypothetical protein JOM56_014250, partial [Amanita muscaria]